MKSEGSGRILIVDDEQQIRRFLRISLASQGYAVLEAENGEQALAAVYTQAPDVVLLDLGLPDMDGHEVLQGIREHSAVPVIVVSVRDRRRRKFYRWITAPMITLPNLLASKNCLPASGPYSDRRNKRGERWPLATMLARGW
ncbi:response regulator [Halomonas sp. PA16-9]|uniref:response regulator n=1 Tax=Halomonas sp. PA16-9 TaxID=2576841 RepID=UPI003FA5D5F0